MLEVNQLTGGYGNLIVIRDITFTLSKGETIAIIGSNGAGKSTLLWALSGLIKHKTGEIVFLGQDISTCNTNQIVKLGIGHVLQGMHVFSSLSVEENLILGAYGQKVKINELIEKKLPIVYKYFPVLERKRKHLADSLSGGEKQMLAISRTLMCDLRLLFLDEPSLGLAPLLVKRLFDILKQLQDEFDLTILLVEQNADVALKFANRGFVLAQGKIVLGGSSQELIENDEVQDIYLGGNKKV